MNDDLRTMLGAAMLVLALAGGCGDSSGDESGNDTQTASATATTTVGEGTGSGSSSASQTAGTTNTTSTTATTTVGESGSSGADATASATATDSSSSGADGSSSDASSSASSSETGMTCSADAQSCANGELCCDGLMCCAGVPVPPGAEYCGMECPDSDRNIKEGFAAVDADATLDKLATLPITSWSYKSEGRQVRHIGPMAQDFKATFEIGGSDKAIAKVDADGVALSAIQGVLHRVQDLERENAELRERLAKLERALGHELAQR